MFSSPVLFEQEHWEHYNKTYAVKYETEKVFQKFHKKNASATRQVDELGLSCPPAQTQ